MAPSRGRAQGSGPRSSQRSAQRPLWARTLDVVADVLAGVGVAIGLVVGLGALAALLDATDSAAGGWLSGTAATLAGPVPDLVASWTSWEPGPGLTALGLGLAALAWAVVGWLLSSLVRPG